eukprot:CAMPEP_0206609338 /NCGR_PEP_ID=MMETSP0325_2-20121206/53706_1 /ASSEMBLY_ACC=CAM_ASM_000347 /TAXON_ID=2866 /ORGANISM="Crypthecodinium cohnii, Strain Seligo" /LENGTH=60 /DNA_ID=CAMNT_0054127563 /DNA_START=189 /DNA_END=367 /DNA_ORIENTATION=+
MGAAEAEAEEQEELAKLICLLEGTSTAPKAVVGSIFALPTAAAPAVFFAAAAFTAAAAVA